MLALLTLPEMLIETLQQVGDQLALPSGSEEIGQVVARIINREGTFSVPVKVEDPIASSPKGTAFREAVQNGDMGCMEIFNVVTMN